LGTNNIQGVSENTWTNIQNIQGVSENTWTNIFNIQGVSENNWTNIIYKGVSENTWKNIIYRVYLKILRQTLRLLSSHTVKGNGSNIVRK
jgi:hypothetical protein